MGRHKFPSLDADPLDVEASNPRFSRTRAWKAESILKGCEPNMLNRLRIRVCSPTLRLEGHNAEPDTLLFSLKIHLPRKNIAFKDVSQHEAKDYFD